MPRSRSVSLLPGLALLLLVASPLLAGEPTEVPLELNGRDVVLPGLAEEGRNYVSLNGIAAALGATVLDDGSGTVRLLTAKGQASFPADLPSLAAVNGKVVSLSAPTLVRDDELYIPVEAFERLFAELEPPGPVEAPEGALPVDVRVAGRSDELRVAIEGDGYFRPSLESRGEDLLVRFGDGVFLRPPYARRTLGGTLLRELVFQQTARGTLLRLRPGPGFHTARIEKRRGASEIEVILGGAPVTSRRKVVGAQDQIGIRRIVIDPGHGGSEDGAIGPSGAKEKDITLQVAFRLRSYLEARGFEVKLTRSVDRDVGLDERAAIANNQRADLFLSLHANASARTGARGAETYFLARDATDDVARTTAALENDAARRGKGSDRDDPEGLDLVLWDLAQVEYLEESAALAETIQEELNQTLGLNDRGVRQAPFRVLMGATMPAVLVEMGFMTHETEEGLLADGRHQDRLAGSIARAVDAFRASYERRLGVSGTSGRARR